MARKRRRGRHKGGAATPPSPDPDAVLDGQVRPDLEGVLRAISEVNPTDRDLPSDEAASRYAVKARLQDLAIDRFGDLLQVQADPADDRVVLLSPFDGRGPATHARVDQLSPDARAWVQYALDTAGSGSPETAVPTWPATSVASAPSRAGQAAPDGAFERGLQALQEYAFDDAERLLLQAFSGAPGDPQVVRSLLGLLVDTLADYATAAELTPRIAAPASSDPGVGVLTGLALAETGDGLGASAAIRGVPAAQAARVIAAICGRRCADGEVDDAVRSLRELRAADPMFEAIPRLERRIAELHAERHRPREEALATLLAAGDLDAAERAAAHLLAEAPANEAAQRALAAVEGRRRDAAATAALDAADRAFERRSWAEAAARYREAIRLGAKGQRAQERLKAAQDESRRRALDEKLQSVRAALQGENREGALLAWCSLDAASRGQLAQEASAPPELAWLSEAAGARGRSPGKQAVRAVVALAKAAALLDEDRHSAALALLAEHARGLDGIPHAAAVRQAAQGAERQARRTGARVRVERAQLAVNDGRAKQALAALDGLDRELLSEEEGVQAEEIGRAAREAADLERLRDAHRAALERDDPLSARSWAERLLERDDPGGEEDWEAAVSRCEAEVRRQWRILTAQSASGLELPGDLMLHAEDEARTWLLPGGQSVALVTTHGRHALVREIGVADGQVRRALALAAPDAFQHPELQQSAGGLWLLDAGAGLVELELPAGRLARHLPIRGLLGGGPTPEQALVTGAGRCLWLHLDPGAGRRLPVQVVDLEGERPPRTIPDAFRIFALPAIAGGPDERVAVAAFPAHSMTVHRPTGTREPGGEVVTPGLVEAVAVAPDGDGWVVLLSNAAVVDDREDDYRLRAVVVRADRRVGPLLALEGSDDESISSMAVSLRHERVFVRVTEAEGAASLRCLRLEAEDGLQEVWRAAAPWETSLVRDPAGVDVVALIPGPDGTGVRPLALGLRPPELPARKRRPLFPIPYESTFCHPPRPTSPAEALERERLEGLSTLEDRGSWATGRVMEGGMEVRGAACLVQALSRRGDGELADDVLALARERFGDDVHLLEVELDRAVARGRWAAVAEACGRIEGVVGEDGMGPHMHHLVGICRLEAGDPVGAIEAWRAAGEGGGVCGLTGAIEAAQAAFLDGDADHPLAVLMRGIEAADVALERGDPECAVGALEGTLVWAWTELQGLARLCRAWLDLTPAAWDGDGPQPDSAQRLRARVAAAAFTAALRSSDHRSSWARPPNLPVPHGRRWDRDRLAALAAEATAWLDAV